MKKTLIVKFGGAAFENPCDFLKRAHLIKTLKQDYPNIVVVVSAMANMTTNLLNLAKKVNPLPPKREQDMLISTGERMSMALMAMALDFIGINAVSFTGSQSGIITCSSHFNAKVLDVKPYRIIEALNVGKVVIVAGFQGVSREKEVTTLGLGGSDTSAVALAISLEADRVQFYKDVSGIYPEDPKKKSQLKPFSYLNYNEALAIVQEGAKILHPRSVVLAKNNLMPLCVSSFNKETDFEGTWIYEKNVVAKGHRVYEISE